MSSPFDLLRAGAAAYSFARPRAGRNADCDPNLADGIRGLDRFSTRVRPQQCLVGCDDNLADCGLRRTLNRRPSAQVPAHSRHRRRQSDSFPRARLRGVVRTAGRHWRHVLDAYRGCDYGCADCGVGRRVPLAHLHHLAALQDGARAGFQTSRGGDLLLRLGHYRRPGHSRS